MSNFRSMNFFCLHWLPVVKFIVFKKINKNYYQTTSVDVPLETIKYNDSLIRYSFSLFKTSQHKYACKMYVHGECSIPL